MCIQLERWLNLLFLKAFSSLSFPFQAHFSPHKWKWGPNNYPPPPCLAWKDCVGLQTNYGFYLERLTDFIALFLLCPFSNKLIFQDSPDKTKMVMQDRKPLLAAGGRWAAVSGVQATSVVLPANILPGGEEPANAARCKTKFVLH